MFYHIVMLRLTDRADAGFHARVDAYLDRVRRECGGLLYYEYGINAADRAKGYGRAMLSVFESSAAHDAYQVSPAHQEMKAYMMPFIADLVVCDSDFPSPAPVGARRG